MNKKGFTLIEILIAITILVVGLVGTIAVIPVAQRIIAKSDVKTRVSVAAAKVAEEIKSKGYDTLKSLSTLNGIESGFKWTALIKDVDASDFDGAVDLPSGGILRIDIDLEYKSSGKVRHEKLVTFYSEI